MRELPRSGRRAWLAAAGLVLATAAAAELAPLPEGRVQFYNIADSDFDPYTADPSPAEQAWMREHYRRMQTYTPYFDTRLAWFPNAWVYKDSYAIKPDSEVFDEHPEWVLRDPGGNLLYIPWGCSGGSCPQYAGDFGNPAFREHWIAEARATLDRGYIGLWVDDVNLAWRVSDGEGNTVTPVDPRTGALMTLADWRRYLAEFMEAIRAAFPAAEIAHNAIWYAGAVDDPYVRRQIRAADYFNLERGATDDGLVGGDGTYGFETWLAFVDSVHALGAAVVMMDYGSELSEREYGLAAWLLASAGRDLMSSNQLAWTAPDRWWSGYELDLGAASAPRHAWNDVLRRDFECGIVLLNQPDRPARTLALDRTYTTLDGAQVSQVVLQARTASILLAPCPDDPPPRPPTDVSVSHGG